MRTKSENNQSSSFRDYLLDKYRRRRGIIRQRRQTDRRKQDTNVYLKRRGNIKFYSVSTTQSPHSPQDDNNFLKKQLELCLKIKETESRLSTVEQLLHTQKIAADEKNRSETLITNLAKTEQLLENHQKRIQELTEEVRSKDLKITALEKSLDDRRLVKNCKEIQEQGNHASGVYRVRPKLEAFDVFCDMETRGGGWTVFQRRVDGSQDFNLTWTEYKEGFGNLRREFWLGLEHLHQLTASGSNQLLVELVDRNFSKAYALYDRFNIAGEGKSYKLGAVTNYRGTAGDSLSYHNDQSFSTREKDTCAAHHGGGWWFHSCLYSNLNGVYFKGGVNSGRAQGINWYTFSTDGFSLLESKMMIRPPQ
ncbi:ficolin-1-A-like [Zophobas morio]|uniref:ficolin-1-A-like n=1 Tax=Zophobas morio TaxID=2755281 RepID=UPI003082A941